MDYNRLTEKAREALAGAQESARERNHAQVEVEHLLLALLDQPGGVVPEVLGKMGVDVSRVRRLIEDDQLVALRRGDPVVRSVPAEMLVDGRIAPYLGGTVTVLRDGGLDDVELLTWLFTEDESLPGRPIDLLRSGQRGEVRRRAQTLAL